MNDMTPSRYRFDPYDRITIGKVHYKWMEKKKNGVHILQRMIGKLAEPGDIPLTDAELRTEFERENIRVELGFYSKARTELRIRNGDAKLLTLSEEELRDVDWKKEWCERFERAAALDPNNVNLSKDKLKGFIRDERELMDTWYLTKYQVRRQAGRPAVPEINPNPGKLVEKARKPFDYPSHSTLNNWVVAWRKAGRNPEAFITRYKHCGNRSQLDADMDIVLQDVVRRFKDQRRFEMSAVFEMLEVKLLEENSKRSGLKKLDVSDTTVYNRIKKLNPFEVEAARHGPRRAARRYAMVGVGNQATVPLERVEMDDWEVDLYTLATKSSIWKKMTKSKRAKFPKVRFTITAAIDCATRCIVGFHISPYAPSTPAVRATLATIFDDKQHYLDFFDVKDVTWPMSGKPEMIVTDGGPVFDNHEIDYTIAQCGIVKDTPEHDERKRGTIEAFFRTLKRLCRNFAGQSFANTLQRGDYEGPEMASLVFEDFMKSLVVFIAKVYHHSKRRGLEGFTPYSRWQKLIAEHDMDPVPDVAQRLIAFGFRHKVLVTLDKHGIQYLGLSYTSDESNALGVLMRQVGYGAKLMIVVNPNDIGSILVHVEEEAHRNAIAPEAKGALFGEFLVISTLPAFRGVTMAKRLMAKDEARKMAKAEQLKGNAFRISGNAFLFEQGDRAIDFLKLNHHGLTHAEAAKLANQIDWFSKAGRGKSPHASRQPNGSPSGFGQPGAKPAKSKSDKHRNGTNKTPAPPPPAGSPDLIEAPPAKPSIGFSRSANLEPYKK